MNKSEQLDLSKIGFLAMWKLGGLTPWDLVRRAFIGYNQHRLSAQSAQFAYYAIFTLFPLLMVLIGCVAQLPIEGLIRSMENAINMGLPHDLSQILFDQIADIQKKTTFSLIMGGVVLLSWGACACSSRWVKDWMPCLKSIIAESYSKRADSPCC